MTATTANVQPIRTAPPRRGLLGLAAWGGMAIVGTMAGVFGNARPAHADPQNSPCCSLASATVCGGAYCNRSCSGTKRYWWCVSGGQTIGCGECVISHPDCWTTAVYCSWWWYVSNCEN